MTTKTFARQKEDDSAFYAGLSLVWVFASILHLIAQLDPSSEAPSWGLYVWLIVFPYWSVSLVITGRRWLRLRKARLATSIAKEETASVNHS